MLKFAVVREDWSVEHALVEQARARACLVVASGGCTALALAHAHPSLVVEAFDLNPDQLRRAAEKARAIARGDLAALNVRDASSRWGASHAAYLRAGASWLVAEGAPGPACFALARELAFLEAQGVPGAVATVYAFATTRRASGAPWVQARDLGELTERRRRGPPGSCSNRGMSLDAAAVVAELEQLSHFALTRLCQLPS